MAKIAKAKKSRAAKPGSLRNAPRKRRYSNSGIGNPAQWLLDAVGGDRSSSGVAVSARTALSLSAVFACVRNIADDVSKVPLTVYRDLDDGGKEPAKKHPVYKLLRYSPNPEMTSINFRRAMNVCAALWGTGYAEIQRNGAGVPVAFWPIHTSRVTPDRTESGALIFKIREPNGTESVIQPENMLVVPGIGEDGIVGFMIPKVGKEVLGLMLAAERFASKFFGNGTRLTGVLRHPAKLTEQAASTLRAGWKKLHNSVDGTDDTAILEEGMEFQSISSMPENAQLLETRVMSVADACRLFRMPPHKIFELSRTSYNSVEHLALEYVGDCLYTWFVTWDQEIKRKCFSVREDDLFAEHNFQNLIAGDMAARTTRQRELFNIGALSQNEIRRQNGENPIGPDGDVYYVNAAMIPIELAKTGEHLNVTEETSAEETEAATETTAEEIDPMDARLTRIAGAHRGLLAEKLASVLQLETDRVQQAAKKTGFAAWAESFYSGHADHVRAKIGGVIDAFCESAWAALTSKVMSGDVMAAVVAETKAIAERHVARSRAEMREPSVIRAWATERAKSVADEEIDQLCEVIVNLANGTPGTPVAAQAA